MRVRQSPRKAAVSALLAGAVMLSALVAAPAVAAPSAPIPSASADTAAAYSRWKADYLVAGCGTGRYYVDASTATSSMVVSEGQGYGMLVTALMAPSDSAARTTFDGLYAYVRDHPSETDPALMAWHQNANCASIPGDASSASDGDLDIAFALLLADEQWGSAGAVDYHAAALELIAAIGRSEINSQTHLPLLGDWAGTNSSYRFGTRTSDLMIDHFRAVGQATGDPLWKQVVTASSSLVTTMQASWAPGTGLLPDFVVGTDATPRPAPTGYLESPNDGDFSWNACRTPWRLAASALTDPGDAASRQAALTMAAWAAGTTGGDPAALRAGYRLNGTELVAYGAPAFLAPMVTAASLDAGAHPALTAFTNAGWAALRSAPVAGYYSDSLRLLGMMLVAGDYRAPLPHPAPSFQRLAGADRFEVSAAISAATFPPGAATAYVASGEVFPDALSASAAAGAEGSPVLLVTKGAVPPSVASELGRLHPQRIVVLGGPNTVGDGVIAALGAYSDTVSRLGGADRFALSAAISASVFSPGRPVAYVASGEVFTDALAGSPAAGLAGGPMLLTRRDGVPSAVAAELRRLAPARIVLLGGVNTVSVATQTELAAIAPVERVAGADRFAVAASISAGAFATGSRTVYIASGEKFPDALSGAAAAIRDRAPVLLVTRDTLPATIAAELARLQPSAVVVLGGTASVSDAVAGAVAGYLPG